jgi:DNA (cytosine-5)-methyltransferase 1
MAWDKDRIAVNTVKRNHPDVNCLAVDQFEILRRPSDFSISGHYDILHLSCPCKWCSKSHTRPGKNDDANYALLLCVGDHLRLFKPLILTMEQVDAVVSHSKNFEPFFGILSHVFREGYNLRFRVMSMKEAGLPAHRDRMILIASR